MLLHNNDSVLQITCGRRQVRAIGRSRLRSRIRSKRKLRDAVSRVSILHLRYGLLTDFVSGNRATNCDLHDTVACPMVIDLPLRSWRSFSSGWTIFPPWHLPWLCVCVCYSDEYRSSIIDKTCRPIAWLILLSNLKLFECRRGLKNSLVVCFSSFAVWFPGEKIYLH